MRLTVIIRAPPSVRGAEHANDSSKPPPHHVHHDRLSSSVAGRRKSAITYPAVAQNATSAARGRRERRAWSADEVSRRTGTADHPPVGNRTVDFDSLSSMFSSS